MRILLTGKNGQLGRCVQDVVAMSNHQLLAFDSKELNITCHSHVKEVVGNVKPDLIINAAAYTAVDKAEEELEQAFAVNELGVRNLAVLAESLGIPVIHISTDYVFDGLAVEPYKPTDRVCPQGVYGASKLAGEKALAENTSRYLVLRTAWVFSEYGNNFVKTMVRLANERDTLSVVADQYGCPTYARDLASAIISLCDLYEYSGELDWGIHHFCGDTPTSWHGFARTIFFKAKALGIVDSIPELTAISSSQYPTLAKRPEYSVLDMSSLLELSPSNWQKSLDIVLQKI